MKEDINVLNIVFVICDTIVCIVAVVGFAYAAIHFGKWWINLFNLIPLLFYSQHTIVVDHDLTLAQKGDDNNA